MNVKEVVAVIVAVVALTTSIARPAAGGPRDDGPQCCRTGSPVLAIDIMPLGDSITEGVADTESQGGYRGRLEGLLTARYHVVWKGSITDAQGRKHEGHSGWTINQLRGGAAGWLTPTQPHWVLLHIGSNDAGQGRSSAQMLADLGALLDLIHANSPAQVVVAQIPEIPLNPPSENASLRAYNAGMSGLAASRYWVQVVDQTHSEISGDGVHPNPQGYGRMALVWRAVWPA